MQTMRISLVVQVVLVALTLGAALGMILPNLPDLVAVRAASPAPQQELPAAALAAGVESQIGSQAVGTTASGADLVIPGAALQVQVRAEVQAAGNANAEAQALGPGNTQAKANTLGPGSSQAVAYTTNPTNSEPASALDQAAALTNASVNNPAAPIPTNFAAPPSAVVREAIINLRSGPGTNYSVMGLATQGNAFTPVGRTADGSWWQVCCYNQQLVWLSGPLADLRGAVDKVDVIAAVPAPAVVVAPAATSTPAPPPAPAPPVVNAGPGYEFGLVEKNQFAESITPRIYLYIAQGAEGLGGYTLQVKKDNTYLPVNVDTFNGPPAFTWPLPIARQRFHNLKVEFPGVEPAGVWEIQVIEDSTRKAVAAPVIFTLVPNDSNQEMYISLRR